MYVMDEWLDNGRDGFVIVMRMNDFIMKYGIALGYVSLYRKFDITTAFSRILYV